MLISFVMTPIALNYLGADRYGLWMAATSLAMMIMAFSDGGISNALVTATAKLLNKTDHKAIRKLIASTSAVLIPLSVSIIIAAILLVPMAPWRWVFSLPSEELGAEAGRVIVVAISSVALGFVADIVLRVRTGLQEIPAVKLWDTIAESMPLPALLLVVYLKMSMVWLVISIMVVPKLIKLLFSAFYLWQHKYFIPTYADINTSISLDLLASGAVFFVAAITNVLAIQSDQVLIAHIVGVDGVTTYSILQRLFTIPWIFANFVIYAQWPTYSSEYARGNLDWIRRTFVRTLVIVAALSAAISTILFLFNKEILYIWVGSDLKPTLLLVIGMAVYSICLVISNTCSMLLISLDARKEQIAMNLIMLAVNIPLSVFLIWIYGTAGAIWGSVIAYLFCLLMPSAIVIPRITKSRTRKDWIREKSI
jgi:O-antigen/teichoic acid export membrane protein